MMRRTAAIPLTAWAATILLEATVAATPGSPLQPKLPPGVAPSGPFTRLADAVGLDRIHGSALVVVAIVATALAGASFLLLAREAWRGHVSVGTVALLAVAGHVVALSLPLLASRDV